MCNGKKGKAKQIKMEGRISRVRIIEGSLAEMQGISLLVRFNSRIQSVRTEQVDIPIEYCSSARFDLVRLWKLRIYKVTV